MDSNNTDSLNIYLKILFMLISLTHNFILIKLCPFNRWCHPTNSSSVVPLSSCPQSFPGSGSFQMSQFFASGGLHYVFIYLLSFSSWESSHKGRNFVLCTGLFPAGRQNAAHSKLPVNNSSWMRAWQAHLHFFQWAFRSKGKKVSDDLIG